MICILKQNAEDSNDYFLVSRFADKREALPECERLQAQADSKDGSWAATYYVAELTLPRKQKSMPVVVPVRCNCWAGRLGAVRMTTKLAEQRASCPVHGKDATRPQR